MRLTEQDVIAQEGLENVEEMDSLVECPITIVGARSWVSKNTGREVNVWIVRDNAGVLSQRWAKGNGPTIFVHNHFLQSTEPIDCMLVWKEGANGRPIYSLAPPPDMVGGELVTQPSGMGDDGGQEAIPF